MADVSSSITSWSASEGSNSPAGTTAISSGLDENLRMIQAVVVQGMSHKGSDIASASTTNLGAVAGLMHDITGTTTITSFGTVRAGILKVVKFEGALTLTHNATSLILRTGANRTTIDGDVGIYISEGSGNWRELAYLTRFATLAEVKAGTVTDKAVAPSTLQDGKMVNGTAIATTSGTTHDFTIPSWAKQVTVTLKGVSLSGTDNLLIQIGDAGGVENTGYTGVFGAFANAAIQGTGALSSGFAVGASGAGAVVSGSVTLTLHNASDFTWAASGVCGQSGDSSVKLVGGYKSLSAALTTVRLAATGSDSFDAGEVNVLYA